MGFAKAGLHPLSGKDEEFAELLFLYNSLMAESEIVFSVQEAPEGGYEARALGYSIFVQAETLAALKEALKDAVRCHFGDGDQPKLIRLHLVKDELIRV